MPNEARAAFLYRDAFETPRVTDVPVGFRPWTPIELMVVGGHTVSRSPNPYDEEIFDIRLLPSGPEPLPPLFRQT
jgi:hypothetical protein